MDALFALLMYGAIACIVLAAVYLVVKRAVKDAWKELNGE